MKQVYFQIFPPYFFHFSFHFPPSFLFPCLPSFLSYLLRMKNMCICLYVHVKIHAHTERKGRIPHIYTSISAAPKTTSPSPHSMESPEALIKFKGSWDSVWKPEILIRQVLHAHPLWLCFWDLSCTRTKLSFYRPALCL